jgi:hypothetical protein
MFKAFSSMMKLEKAPITPDEIAYVETAVPTGDPKDVAEHARALSGSREACYGLSLAYFQVDPERAYMWATMALLAGHLEANGWMKRLEGSVSRQARYQLEIIARKWFLLHKADFVREKAARAEAMKGWKR